HVRNAILSKEHVFRTAEADALSAECARLDGIARDVSVGAHAHFAERLGPTQDGQQLRIVGGGGHQPPLALDDAARSAVEREPIAFAKDGPLHAHGLRLLVDSDLARTHYTALPHAAGDDRRVAGHATT